MNNNAARLGRLRGLRGMFLHKGSYLTILLGSVYCISNSTHNNYGAVRLRHH